MDPLDFLAVADSLSKQTSEAEWRTSVGRAYYGLFAYAVQRLNKVVVLPPGSDVHKCVRHYLMNSGHADLRRVAQTLENLRTIRNTADYRMAASITAANAQFAVASARNAQALLSSVSDVTLQKHATKATPCGRLTTFQRLTVWWRS